MTIACGYPGDKQPQASGRICESVIGTPVDVIDWTEAVTAIQSWASRRESRIVSISNVHSVVTARRDPDFAAVLGDADLVTPDGAPIAWMMRRLGRAGQERINGPDLMWRYCEEAARRDEKIFLYGSTPRTLAMLQQRLLAAFPTLQIAGAHSPPFRPLSAAEDEAVVREIVASGASTVWVSLGCPKQEQWMASHRGRVPAVMIGVGAAFDYHAGAIRRAPLWMQHHGLEWLHRLATEPRRLWRRYLSTNSVFVVAALVQLAKMALVQSRSTSNHSVRQLAPVIDITERSERLASSPRGHGVASRAGPSAIPRAADAVQDRLRRA